MPRALTGWLLVCLQVILLVALVVVPRADPNLIRIAIGAVLIILGLLFGIAAGIRLGTALTPTPVPVPGAALRTEGPYRLVRHPIYSAVLLASLGYAIALGSWWTWFVLLLLVLFFWAKSRWEDSLLRQAHGPEWELWMSTTGALVPRLPARRGMTR